MSLHCFLPFSQRRRVERRQGQCSRSLAARGRASSLVEVFGGLCGQQVDGLHLQRCAQTAEGLRIGTPAHVFDRSSVCPVRQKPPQHARCRAGCRETAVELRELGINLPRTIRCNESLCPTTRCSAQLPLPDRIYWLFSDPVVPGVRTILQMNFAELPFHALG